MTTLSVPRSGPIGARIRPPGSKSITNRALVVASLSGGTSMLHDPLESKDTEAMRRSLVLMGVGIRNRSGVWEIDGCNGRFGHTDSVLDVQASGTTARFLTAALTLATGTHTIDGVERMRERPIGELSDALAQMGATVETTGGYPPVTVTGTGLHGGEIVIDASRSSQFVSAVMLVAPYADGDVTVRFKDDLVISRPYLDTTAETMRTFGAEVEVEDHSILIRHEHRYQGSSFTVEPDASAAAYPLVAAAITGGWVEIEGLSGTSSQADVGILDALEQMGCRVERRSGSIHLTGPPEGRLTGIRIDMNAMPDAVLALAVAAVFADGPTVIENVASLRLKETDRLAASENELRKLGVGAEAGPDSLAITPVAQPHGGVIATYDDHRMAMAFALAGLRIEGIEIEDPECVAKTWPDYFSALDAILVPTR